MASIVATPLPALGVVKIIIDWTPDYFSDPVTVYRITPDGEQHTVIGSPVNLSMGRAILYDSSAPFDVALTYRAQIVDPIVAVDYFGRTVSPGWGTPTRGAGPYVVHAGIPGDFRTFIFPGEGRITVDAINAPRIIALPTAYLGTVMETTVRAPSSIPTGQAIQSSLFARYIDNSNYYQYALTWLTNGTAEARIFSRATVPGVVMIGSKNLGPYEPNEAYRIRARTNGTSLQMTAWKGDRPSSVTIKVNDDTQTGPGFPAWGAVANSGSTVTLPFSLNFDTTIVRSIGTITLNSNSVTLVAGRDGWVRDPQNPTVSVRLDNCASHTLSCLDAERFVFFQGLDDESYQSATGVFDVIDAENPLTVAQTRKSKSSALRLVSTTLADIPPLKTLFRSGRDLVVSLPADYGWGLESYGSEPVTVGDVQVSRLNRRDMRKPQRLWVLPVRVVDPDETFPSGSTGSNNIPIPGATFGDMKATGLTYLQLATAGKKYQDWAQGVFT